MVVVQTNEEEPLRVTPWPAKGTTCPTTGLALRRKALARPLRDQARGRAPIAASHDHRRRALYFLAEAFSRRLAPKRRPCAAILAAVAPAAAAPDWPCLRPTASPRLHAPEPTIHAREA